MSENNDQQTSQVPQAKPIPLLKPPPPELFQQFSSSSSASMGSKQNNFSGSSNLFSSNPWNGNDFCSALHGPMESSDDYIARLEAKLSKGMKVPPPKLAKRLQDEREAKIFNGELSDDEDEGKEARKKKKKTTKGSGNDVGDDDDDDEYYEEEDEFNDGSAILLSNAKPISIEDDRSDENDEMSQSFLTKEERESYLREDDEMDISNNGVNEGNVKSDDDDQSCKCELCIIS